MARAKPAEILNPSIAAAAIVLITYICGDFGSMPFYGLMGIASFAIAFAMFAIVWDPRGYLANNYLWLLGISYASSTLIGLLNPPPALWLAAHYATTAALAAASLLIKRALDRRAVFSAYAIASTLLFAAMFVGYLPGGIAAPEELAPQETDTARTSPTPTTSSAEVLIVTHQYYPYQYVEDGELKGFVAAIVEEAFRRMGLPADIKLYPFARAHKMVSDGAADGIFTVAKTTAREGFAFFPDEVLIWQTMSLFVKADSPLGFDGDLGKLRHYRIGVINKYRYGNVFDDVVDDGTLLNIKPANSAEGNVKMLVAGRLDYWVSNRELAAFVLGKLRLSDKVRELKPTVQTLPTYLMFSKKRGTATLSQRFGEEVRRMKADGSYDRIIADYWQMQLRGK